MSDGSLFDPDEIQPARRLGPEAMRERLVSAYAQALLETAPVRSLSPAEQPDPAKRRKTALQLAEKDVSRLLSCVKAAGLEISDAGRVRGFKLLLSEWISAMNEDEASGGNGAEGVDYDDLRDRSSKALEGGIK